MQKDSNNMPSRAIALANKEIFKKYNEDNEDNEDNVLSLRASLRTKVGGPKMEQALKWNRL